MIPNPNPSPEEALRHLELLALNTAQTAPAARKVNECVSLLTAALSPQTLPAPGEVEARAAHIAAYSGAVVSFDVTAPYYLASCDSCGWVGSSEHCGTDTGCDDSNLYCPRCDASGADCGKIATQTPPWTAATVAEANDEGVARKAEHARIVGRAKQALRLTQGCMECNADDERRWMDTIRWLEEQA